MISADEALDAYEAARHRLPEFAPGAGGCRAVASLADLAEGFDVFLLDAFGVLNVGERVIPGVPESVAHLQDLGKRVLVVSNAASVPVAALVEKYARLGFRFAAEDVVTSRAAMAAKMNGQSALCWGVVAPDGSDLSDLGLPALLHLQDDPAAYAACDGVLLLGSGGWSAARQDLLEAALCARPRPVVVANPDIVAPREAGFSVEPGHIAHRLADVTEVEPEFFGKPFGNIYDLTFERLGDVDPARVLMVGDSLHTDILGARAYGIASALVPGFGFFSGGKVEEAMARTGIVPDFLVERP